MKPLPSLPCLVVAVLAAFLAPTAQADNMVSIGITPATGQVTLVPRWTIGSNLAGFHEMSQDLSLGGGANQFYSIKRTVIPAGGDIAAFTHYIAADGAASDHADIGSKLTPDSYSALTSADPDIGYGSVNFYLIHHKVTGDYFSVIIPGSAVSSSVTDEKPMSGPGGPATLGASGYFGLTFSAANLGYGLNKFYYLRTDSVSGYAWFGVLAPELLGTSADQFDLGMAGYNALTFTGTDVGFGTDKMYYLRLDPVTGYTVLGTLHPGTGETSDIANLGSVYSTLDFVPGDVGFGTGRFYATGSVNPTWQSVSFAAIVDRDVSDGSFTVKPTSSSGLSVALTLVTGSATISPPVAGVYTVTPISAGLVILQATQVGQASPTAYESNMLRQSFLVTGGVTSSDDFNHDGQSDILWRNTVTHEVGVWLMDGTTSTGYHAIVLEGGNWTVIGTGDFNHDGQSDILWRNSVSHEMGVWLMNGTTSTGYQAIALEGGNWTVIGTGDFNHDGQSDILWRNSVTHEVGVWLMNGTTSTGYQAMWVEGGNWTVIGTGDFNHDGQSDILWRNSVTHEVGVWLMNGTTSTGYHGIWVEGGNWTVIGTGDFNSDGQSDIIWKNSATHEVGVWLMNGTTSTGYHAIALEGGNWQVINN